MPAAKDSKGQGEDGHRNDETQYDDDAIPIGIQGREYGHGDVVIAPCSQMSPIGVTGQKVADPVANQSMEGRTVDVRRVATALDVDH